MTVASQELGEDGHTTRGQGPGDILHKNRVLNTGVLKLKFKFLDHVRICIQTTREKNGMI